MAEFDNATDFKVQSELDVLAEAKRELEIWKARVDEATNEKDRLQLEKLEEDDAKREAQKEMEAILAKQSQHQREFQETIKEIQAEILKLKTGNQKMEDRLKVCQDELERKTEESVSLKSKSMIHAQIPEVKIKFAKVAEEEVKVASSTIKAVFTITQKPVLLLSGGQALITFEKEQVASQILKMARCSVACEQAKIDVKPNNFVLEPYVKFEFHIELSKKELKFSNARPSLPEERMKDRLELSFSRPSRGGGEVERLDYNKDTGTGTVTFCHTGVAENLFQKGHYQVDLGSKVTVNVEPVYEVQLHKFQTFCGVSKRTVLLDGIQDVEDVETIEDHLEIHFQNFNNYGGEIETVKYNSHGQTLPALFTEV